MRLGDLSKLNVLDRHALSGFAAASIADSSSSSCKGASVDFQLFRHAGDDRVVFEAGKGHGGPRVRNHLQFSGVTSRRNRIPSTRYLTARLDCVESRETKNGALKPAPRFAIARSVDLTDPLQVPPRRCPASGTWPRREQQLRPPGPRQFRIAGWHFRRYRSKAAC